MTRHAGTTSKETKARILAAAAKEFAEKGYDDASLRHICGQANVTTGALYFFFENKEDLFRNVTDQPFTQIENLAVEMLLEFLKYDNASWDEEALSDLMATRLEELLSGEGAAALSLLRDLGHPALIDRSKKTVQRVSELTYQYLAQFHKINPDTLPADDPLLYWIAQIQVGSFSHLIKYADNDEKLRRQSRLVIRYACGGLAALAKE